MSYQALDWVDNLDHNRVPYLPYRVLLKLANVADTNGQRAFRSKAQLAAELNVTQRAIQDAFKQLQQARLLKRGDQRHVLHLPANRRPIVYDLMLPKQATELFDMDQPEVEAAIPGEKPGEKPGEQQSFSPSQSGENQPRFRTLYRRTDISTTHSDPTTGAHETPSTCTEGHPLTVATDPRTGLWIVACRDGHQAAETVIA